MIFQTKYTHVLTSFTYYMTDIIPLIYSKISKKNGYRQVSRSLIYARSLVVKIHNKLNPSKY